jgi:hypothetical protein
MGASFDQNPLTKFWVNLSFNGLLLDQLSVFMKLVELVVIQMLGLMKDEKCFNTFNMMKQNWRTGWENTLLFWFICIFKKNTKRKPFLLKKNHKFKRVQAKGYNYFYCLI